MNDPVKKYFSSLVLPNGWSQIDRLGMERARMYVDKGNRLSVSAIVEECVDHFHWLFVMVERRHSAPTMGDLCLVRRHWLANSTRCLIDFSDGWDLDIPPLVVSLTQCLNGDPLRSKAAVLNF